ncbi:Hsp70 family protein [Anaerosalibacter bizertensis]|uniref:Hsp70 family protein n=1 Tax=Anaerosalibacter bizertensis TaxID=932217 RepID=UPI0035135C52
MLHTEDYFGIDFGTTNSSVVSVIKSGNTINIDKFGEEGERPFPSLLAIDKISGEVYFGEDARTRRRELSDSCEIISSVKSYIDTDKKWDIAGEVWTPEIVVAQIFKSINERIHRYYNRDIKDAMISVPIGFSSSKRKIIRKALDRAGIQIKGFINESTSAIFKNYEEVKHHSKLAVFDWGGGTLDISIVELNDGKVYERATNGIKLGGDDIDVLLAKWVHSKIAKAKNLNIAFEEMDKRDQDRMLAVCEQAKKTLTYEDIKNISLMKYGDLGSFNIPLDIDMFSELISPLVEKALDTLKDTVKMAEMNMKEITGLIMVGGSSNLRPLYERIEELWGEELDVILPQDPEWNIAEGAALLNMDSGEFRLNQDIGVLLSDNSFFPIIERHTTVPIFNAIEHQYGLVDDSNSAVFLFSDNKIDPLSKEKNVLDRISIEAKGFFNENIVTKSYIDEDLVFKSKIKSSHLSDEYEEYEYSNLKFYYTLPDMSGDIR